MEIVVKGRHLSQDVGESFREHCRGKLSRLERFDHRLRRLDVELSHEPNPRRAGECERIEITVRSRGPVVRAEAAQKDCYAAFELAYAKIEERMRRAASRQKASHSHSHHAHLPGAAGAAADPLLSAVPEQAAAVDGSPGETELVPGLVVREKQHDAEPMHLDEALHRMELVGHDFYLFCCADTGQPSVVYRRHGYDYGVLRLGVAQAGSQAAAQADGGRLAARSPVPVG